MPSRIHAQHGASTAMTITLASLASSTAGVGKQTTLVSNDDDAQMVRVYFKVTTGTTPTANKSIQFYLITGDDPSSSNIRTDNAGASDAGITILSARLVNVVQTNSTSNTTYRDSFLIRNPGREWGIAIVHDTVANLHATAGNHE